VTVPVSAHPREDQVPKSESSAAKLRTLLGDHPSTRQLKAGAIASPRVTFDFADVKVPNRAFKQVVRENAFDLAELAIITYLQAKALGKPLVLLPATIVGRHQHGYLVYNPARGELAPSELAGRRVGVRSYPVTTATWVRGILAHDHGVDLDRVRWVTFEDPHLAEYREPPTAERAPPGKDPLAMLQEGELDAAVVGAPLPADSPLAPLIPDPNAAGREWCLRNHAVPINHLAVVKQSLVESRPEIVREVYGLLREARQNVPAPADGINMLPFGVDALRPSLALAIDYAFEQGLLARRLEVDELFDDTTRAL
jgi:4,5-dihydroxyphthalate decarboxylase